MFTRSGCGITELISFLPESHIRKLAFRGSFWLSENTQKALRKFWLSKPFTFRDEIKSSEKNSILNSFKIAGYLNATKILQTLPPYICTESVWENGFGLFNYFWTVSRAFEVDFNNLS